MKTKEFIKRVEELGFEVMVFNNRIHILANNFTISVAYIYQAQFTFKEYKEIKKKLNTDLKDFELVEVKK